jgi:ribonuclease III
MFKLREFKKKYDFLFYDNYYLSKAFSSRGYHASFDNETLETLGDVVLKVIVTFYLYTKFPEYGPDRLSSERVKIINNNYLGKVAKQNKLFMFL